MLQYRWLQNGITLLRHTRFTKLFFQMKIANLLFQMSWIKRSVQSVTKLINLQESVHTSAQVLLTCSVSWWKLQLVFFKSDKNKTNVALTGLSNIGVIRRHSEKRAEHSDLAGAKRESAFVRATLEKQHCPVLSHILSLKQCRTVLTTRYLSCE